MTSSLTKVFLILIFFVILFVELYSKSEKLNCESSRELWHSIVRTFPAVLAVVPGVTAARVVVRVHVTMDTNHRHVTATHHHRVVTSTGNCGEIVRI